MCRCGFLQTEVKILLQCLEDMDIADPSDGSYNETETESANTLTISSVLLQSHCWGLAPWQSHYMMYSVGTSSCFSLQHLNLRYNDYVLYCSLQEGQSQLTVKINQWTEVSTLVQLDSEETEVSKSLWTVKVYSCILIFRPERQRQVWGTYE